MYSPLFIHGTFNWKLSKCDGGISFKVALICIMAQIGSFVPADEAELGIIDAVYTRYFSYLWFADRVIIDR